MQFWAPDDGRKTRLKHVERLTEINKLWNVASCWLNSVNILAMHGPMNVKHNVELLDKYWIGNYVELSDCGIIYGDCCPGTSFKVLSRARRPADTITVTEFIFPEYFTPQGKIPAHTAPTFGLLSPIRKAVLWIVTLGLMVSWIKAVCFRWPIYCLYQPSLPVFRPRFETGIFRVQVSSTTTRTNLVEM